MCVHRKQAGGLKPLQPARFDRGRCQPPSHDQPAHCNTLRHHSDISACCSGHRGSLRSNWLASLQRMFSAEDLRYCLQRALNVQVLCRGSRMFQCEQCSWACVPVVLMQSPLRISSAAGSAMLAVWSSRRIFLRFRLLSLACNYHLHTSPRPPSHWRRMTRPVYVIEFEK